MGEGRSSYTFLCYHNQISISVSLPFSNARHGMGAGKCKEKSACRLDLASAAGLGSPGVVVSRVWTARRTCCLG